VSINRDQPDVVCLPDHDRYCSTAGMMLRCGIHAVLHWQGADHTELQVKQRLNAAGRHNPRIPDDTIALMRELARLMPDRQIARLLNRIGIATGHGNAWTQERVRGFRNHTRLPVTATANGLSAARSRSRQQRKSSGYAI
jgi:hypothetical protein